MPTSDELDALIAEARAMRLGWIRGYPVEASRVIGRLADALSALRDTNPGATTFQQVADLLAKHGPVPNYELNYDGTSDPLRAAYAEGQFDAWSLVNSFALEARSVPSSPEGSK